MYERFTDRARKAIQLAHREAQRFNHEYIGTEHLLLGLIAEGSGVAAVVLNNLGVKLDRVRTEVVKIVQCGPETTTMGRLPHTPRTKKALEYAIEESQTLNHGYIGTEHLLIGLLREFEGVAAQVLMNMGMSLDAVRAATLKEIELNPATEEWVLRLTGGKPAPKVDPDNKRWWQFWR